MQSTNDFKQLNESTHELMVCPKCHEKSLHIHSFGHYQCIFCDFEKNLSDPVIQNISTALIVIVCVSGIVFGGISLLLANREPIKDAAQTARVYTR
jgi:hypothetical protein